MVALPLPFSTFRRTHLLFNQPTPIEQLHRLTAHLDCGAIFWIKREDCNSGLAFGGNKVRKLEYVLQDAIDTGADTIVTTGGLQSNHMRQTAAAAARLGLKISLIPTDRVPTRDSEYRSLGNIQLTNLMSAEHFVPDTPIDEALATIKGRGNTPYFIPSGASTHPLGGLGFARWIFELAEQEEELGIYFDTIVVALASGSTLAGMVAGQKLLEKSRQDAGKDFEPRKLVGVVAMPSETQRDNVLQIAKTTAEKIGVDPSTITEESFIVDTRYTAGAYGQLDEATSTGIKELATTEGILADPVYTGKAVTGLLDMARNGEFGRGSKVLFCHTGGQISLSAYPSLR